MAGERLLKSLSGFRKRYGQAKEKEARTAILDGFCRATGYSRKYAIALLNKPADTPSMVPRRRGVSYSPKALQVIEHIWKAAGYPWSVRLKALLPVWLPWARMHLPGVTAALEAEIRSISARQLDRRLSKKRRQLKRRLYGRTKPGTLLKHHIPIKTDCWDVDEPGYTEIDLVSHSGPCASGEFIYSLNVTDIHTGWVETCPIMGKSERAVVEALNGIRRRLPFPLKGIDSDNGSEFINHHLYRYCQKHAIQFTRGRPYKKDDNAHIEQKNWTHVRQFLGWDRFDSPEALSAIKGLYQGDLSRMMNLFQPSVKLIAKERVGSRLRRRYDAAKTPLDRLAASYETEAIPLPVQRLLALRETIDPFALSRSIDKQLDAIAALRHGTAMPQKHSVLSI